MWTETWITGTFANPLLLVTWKLISESLCPEFSLQLLLHPLSHLCGQLQLWHVLSQLTHQSVSFRVCLMLPGFCNHSHSFSYSGFWRCKKSWKLNFWMKLDILKAESAVQNSGFSSVRALFGQSAFWFTFQVGTWNGLEISDSSESGNPG